MIRTAVLAQSLDDDYSWSDLLDNAPPDVVLAFIALILAAFLVVRIIFR